MSFYGEVIKVDGGETYHVRREGRAIDAALIAAKTQALLPDGKPTLICCKTVIGQGSPNKAGTHDVHGAALGAAEVAATREALFDEADVLSVHVRLLPETRGMVTAEDLARMKPSAVFVNTSRAELVAAGALEAALRAGRPGAAALDVFESEPMLDANHPLLKLDNVVATPHLGYMERDQMNNYFSDNFKRVLAFAGGKPYGVVNPAALEAKR